MESQNNKDYVSVVYDENERPITSYPFKLANYIFDKYALKEGSKILDIGCGRGDFLRGFIDCGLKGYATDQSDVVLKYLPSVQFKKTNLEKEGIPYPDNFFDIVYSKSVIEHFYNPEILVKEMYRVLKPGGIAITLCPSWEYNYKIYFEDYTHRSPFMKASLRDIQLINGFKNVKVEFFRQLPILWKRNYLNIFAEITRVLLPDSFYSTNSVNTLNKWIRFSKEIMLLSSSKKPK
tara:strand:+ start:64 stop:768 length:705 start_codon:yes stop_codon:yes gene_type:complete